MRLSVRFSGNLCGLLGVNHLLRWVVVVFFLDTSSCMWTAGDLDFIVTSIGPANFGVYTFYDGQCPLVSIGTYPYLVKIYADTSDAHLQIKTGVILAHNAVLTVCRGFNIYSLKQLSITAQRIFRTRGEEAQFCYQTRRPVEKIPHPKCVTDPTQDHSIDKFWDFQVLKLDSMFIAEHDFAYPTIQIPKQPTDLMQFIRKVNILHPDVEGCELPYFLRPDTPWAVLAYAAKVDSKMRDRDLCIEAICSIRETKRRCVNTLQTYMNYTFMCVQPKFMRKFDLDETIHPKHGAPLVCNNTGIGTATDNILRPGKNHDWYLIATYLRVWPWLMKMKHQFWEFTWNRPVWDSPFLEYRPWSRSEESYNTERWDKNIVKDFVRFKFVTRPPDGNPLSGVNRLQVTSTNFIHAALILIVLSV